MTHPELLRLIAAGDAGLDQAFSPRVLLCAIVCKPPFVPARENDLVAATLQSHIGSEDPAGGQGRLPTLALRGPRSLGSGERRLIADVEVWFDYREKRNLTFHTYDERKAGQVFAILPRFTKDAADLLSRAWITTPWICNRGMRPWSGTFCVDWSWTVTLALRALKEAFEESDLPFRVDTLDWADTDAWFREIILANRVPLHHGGD